PVGPSSERLHEFRGQYPMDDRAWNFLGGVGGAIQQVVVSDFRPKRENDPDYSAAVTAFVRSVESREGRRGAAAPPSLFQLESFRERFPMDDRAFDYLCVSAADVQREALQNFSPKRLEETDFSRQLTAFLRKGPRTGGQEEYSRYGGATSRDERDGR
ncbi:unnamed protein product, partial [Polarella glacialis]